MSLLSSMAPDPLKTGTSALPPAGEARFVLAWHEFAESCGPSACVMSSKLVLVRSFSGFTPKPAAVPSSAMISRTI